MTQPQISFEQLKSQVSRFKTDVAAQAARVQQAEATRLDMEAQILRDFGIPADQIEPELAKLEVEINSLALDIHGMVGQ